MDMLLRKNLSSKSAKVVFTKNSLWLSQAPSFNFEMDEEQMLAYALEVGFVTKIGDDEYLRNNNYWEVAK